MNGDYKASKLPEPDENTIIDHDENTVLTVDQHSAAFTSNFASLNRAQLEICEDVVKSIEHQIPNRLFFVDGPGGTGKTYLLEVI